MHSVDVTMPTDCWLNRPVRYANQLPPQIEGLIVTLKHEKPHWGARKIRELLVRRAGTKRYLFVRCGHRGRRAEREGFEPSVSLYKPTAV